MTPAGGTHGKGTILDILTDGSGYNVDYDFTGGPNDGANPEAGLLFSVGNLFGTTDTGGTSNLGTIFEFTPIPEPSTLLLTGAAGVLAYLYRRRRMRRLGGCKSDAIGERRP